MGVTRKMNENKSLARKTKILFGCWCALYAIFDTASSIYISFQQVIKGNDPTSILSSFQLATLAIIVLFFIPSLTGIYYLTKKYDSKKLRKVVFGLLVILSIWSVAMSLYMVVAKLFPGFVG